MWDPKDSIEFHVKDTLVAGVGLCEESSVREFVRGGPDVLRWLVEQGVPFTKESNGELHLTL